MKVPELLDNLAIISQLGDNPGTDDGLSAEALKAKFDEAALIIQRYINGTLLPSLNQVVPPEDSPGESPEDGLTMKNDIDMGGHRVKNMAAPEEDGDAVSLGYAKQHIGGSNIADSTYPDCYYRMVDGVKEWINPPMIPTVEYRTTERYNGKVVYTKLVYGGKMPDSGNLTIELGNATTMPKFPFREESYVCDSDWNGDRAILDGFYSTSNGVKKFTITPTTSSAQAGFNAYLQIWYFKD